MLEIDCHLTEDGQVVVSHDNDLHRSAGLHILISETKFQELPLIKQSLSLDFCGSKWQNDGLVCKNTYFSSLYKENIVILNK